jgi:hypothetical protein
MIHDDSFGIGFGVIAEMCRLGVWYVNISCFLVRLKYDN